MDNTTEYEKQATDFLASTGTKFTAKYKDHGYHFPNDDRRRDIYNCVLKNKSHRFSFTFGQSLKDSDGNTPPTAYDILAGITKAEVGDFEDFCRDFGYDSDSRTAHVVYKAVLREWKNVEKLFTPKQLESLQELS